MGARALLQGEGGFTHFEGLRGVATIATEVLEEVVKSDETPTLG